MESLRLFVSPDGEYFVNLHFDTTLHRRSGNDLIFCKKLSTIKNPDTVCFSDDSKMAAVKNNNNLIEIFNLDSGKRIFKGKGPREFGCEMFFVDNTTLLSSTYSGKIFTVDITTGQMNCLGQLNLDNVEIIKVNNNRYLILGDERDNSTSVLSLSIEKNEATINLIHSCSARVYTHKSCFVNNKLYVLSEHNEEHKLFVFNYNIDNNSITSQTLIDVLSKHDSLEYSKHAFDIIYKFAPDIVIPYAPTAIPIDIVSVVKDKYIIIAFNYVLVVYDIEKEKELRKYPFKDGVSAILSTDEGNHIWISSTEELKHITIDDIINDL